MTSLSFVEKINSAIERNHSLLCLGLDPEISKINPDFEKDQPQEIRILKWCQDIIQKTEKQICCVKPNIAFFEQYGPKGMEVLQKIIDEIPHYLPVILDIKRGDIGSTAIAYAKAAFQVYKADAVTLNPYLGKDSIEPFVAFPGKMVFVLCQTSNPSANEIQQHGTPELYKHVAKVAQNWGSVEQLGFVTGATQPESLYDVRSSAPEHWILAPGVGAQGGDLQATLEAGLRADGLGIIIPVSRSIIYADDPGRAAAELRDKIEKIRDPLIGLPTVKRDDKSRLASELHKARCVQFGDFTLASGKKSPIYIDLRKMMSFPGLMRLAIDEYENLLKRIQFDKLGAVPYAALPVAANIAWKNNYSMIYPRKEVKTHGSGLAIEGDYQKGQSVVLIEDIITTGGSIISAIETLESAGLFIKDVIVLIDRQQGGKEALAARSVQLHAALTIRELLDLLYNQQLISQDQFVLVKVYLENDKTS